MQSPDREGTAHAAAVNEPQNVLDLGNGLELWRVPPSAVRVQDVNARFMPKAMFDRLSQTVARDSRLESLPLCAKTERGLEIISGHHRVRVTTAAGLSDLFAIVDTTGLTRSQIASKQLAHNAIQGQDHDQLLAEIYRQIEDAESKLDVELPKVRIEGCGVSVEQPERVHLKDIFGTSWIPKEAASTIGDAVQEMVKASHIGQTNRWQALEYWAADYLGKA